MLAWPTDGGLVLLSEIMPGDSAPGPDHNTTRVVAVTAGSGPSRLPAEVDGPPDQVAASPDGIYLTGRFPVGIYPGWLRYSVTFLVPIAFAVTVPAEALTSRLDWRTMLLAVVFAIVLFSFTRWFWRFGLRRYSGASA